MTIYYKFLSNEYLPPVKSICTNQLGINAQQFEEIYKYFYSTFYSENAFLEDKFGYVPIQHLTKFNSDLLQNKTSFGVDLPVWFTKPQGKRLKIFLLSMDPLRTRDENIIDKASLNSPFSIHQKKRNNYFHSIEKLAQSFDLYVTDVYKLFYRDSNNFKSVSNESPEFIAQPIHLKILKTELSIFQPDFILCLGKHAIGGLAKLDTFQPNSSIVSELTNYNFQGIPTFAIPHASGIASRWAKKFMEKNGHPYDYSTYLYDVVQLVLKT